MTDAFGYREDGSPQLEPVGLQVAEALHRDYLTPGVVLYLRFSVDNPEWNHVEIRLAAEDVQTNAGTIRATEQLGITLTVDSAEWLAAELTRWAQRARDKAL